MSRSLAVHPQADRFVLGTDWNLWNFGKDGRPLWRRSAPASVLGGGGTPSRLIGAAVLWQFARRRLLGFGGWSLFAAKASEAAPAVNSNSLRDPNWAGGVPG